MPYQLSPSTTLLVLRKLASFMAALGVFGRGSLESWSCLWRKVASGSSRISNGGHHGAINLQYQRHH